MNSRIVELAKYRLEKAKQAKADAEILIENSSCSSAVNRIYYSIFYAARALPATKGLDSSKHSGVISLFNKEFVKSGIMSKQSGKILGDVFGFRIKGDYEDYAEISQGLSERLLNDGTSFIAEAEKVLNQLLGRKNGSSPSPVETRIV